MTAPLAVERGIRRDRRGPGDQLTGVATTSRLRRLTEHWDTTPGKLRAARALVLGVLLATVVVGLVSARARVDAIDQIESRTEPLNADAIEVYRVLADADTTAAGEFLSDNDAAITEARSRFADDFERAASNLAHAGTLAGHESLRTRRIAAIAREALVYSTLVERARTKRALGAPWGDDLRQASELMRATVLRLSETLQRTESANLDGEYRRAQSVPTPALALGVVSLATLALLQLFLFRKTRRVLNIGLVAASAALLATAAWWGLALSISSSSLESARRHSQTVTDALGEAQIAARQARASELLALVADAGVSDQNFVDKILVLTGTDGRDPASSTVGGALAAAGQLARTTPERDAVQRAGVDAANWLKAHATIRSLKESKRSSAAVALAIRNDGDGAGAAFQALDKTLGDAIRAEDSAFERDIGQAGGVLRGFVVVTGLLGIVAGVFAARGITVRLEEYR